jgi:signal transduction histidine kinase
MVILLLIGGMGYISTRQLTATVDSAHQSQAVLDTLDQLVDVTVAIDSAERERTRRDVQPSQLSALLARVDTLSFALRRVIGEGPADVATLDSLAAQMSEQRAVLSQESAPNAPSARVRTASTEQLVADIRRTARRIEAEQGTLLRQRRDETRVRLRISMLVLGIAFAAAFALTAVATFRVEREMADRRAAELKALEAREVAETASRTKSDFLASMSHELRTPLNSIIGFANVLLKNRGGTLGEQELLFLQRIRDNGTHQLHLIDDLLDLSAIEAGKQRLVITAVSLEELIRDTVGQFEGRITSKEVVLRVDLPTRMLPVETDSRKLRQVLINLVGNALKFTPAGSVRVSVQVSPTTLRPLRIDVTDTGIGIPANRLEAIFDPFEQVENGMSQKGTGLGLTIARSLCHLMGYRLTVASDVGKGSVFSIHLETAPAPAPAEPQAAPAPEAITV